MSSQSSPARARTTRSPIYNNLFLRGGLKNREGFFRVVENNIMVNNGFHPHVWYKHSEDIVRRNIMTNPFARPGHNTSYHGPESHRI